MIGVEEECFMKLVVCKKSCLILGNVFQTVGLVAFPKKKHLLNLTTIGTVLLVHDS